MIKMIFILWRTFTALRLYDKEYLCCLLVLQLCNSFMANTCLMYAVITLNILLRLSGFGIFLSILFHSITVGGKKESFMVY